MSQSYSFLAGMFHILSWDQHLDKDGIVYALKNSISNWYQDKSLLKEEMQRALLDPSFNWVEVAFENEYIYEKIKPQYTNNDIIYEVYSYVWDYLYPEKALSAKELDELAKMAIEILKDEQQKSDGWILQSEIGKMLGQKYPKFNPVNTFFLSDMVEQGILLRKKNDGIDPNGFMKYNYSLKIAGKGSISKK